MSDYTIIEETEDGYRHVVAHEVRFLDPDGNEIDADEYPGGYGEGYGG